MNASININDEWESGQKAVQIAWTCGPCSIVDYLSKGGEQSKIQGESGRGRPLPLHIGSCVTKACNKK